MKRIKTRGIINSYYCFREGSKKTRIETFIKKYHTATPNNVLEKVPRKQGLKLNSGLENDHLSLVLEKVPRKQGLKLNYSNYVFSRYMVLEKVPRKQGLKLYINSLGLVLVKCFREGSKKTRIETGNRHH